MRRECDVDRATASATFAVPLGTRATWTGTGGWGRNSEEGHATNALLLESALDLDGRNVVWGRAESVQKTGRELSLPGIGEATRWLGKVAVAYVRQHQLRFGSGGALLGAGVGASVGLVPAGLAPAYGGRWPYGFLLFLNARPAPMRMESRQEPDAMPGMSRHAP